MSTKRTPPPPEHFNTGDMSRDWDARARACAREYILTGFAERPHDFVRSGQEAAASLLAFCPPGAVALDLGCGLGRVARELEPHVTRAAFASYIGEIHRALRPGGLFCFSVVSRHRSPAYEVDDARDTFTGRAYGDAELAGLLRGRFEEERRWLTDPGEAHWRVTYINLGLRKPGRPRAK